MEKGIAIGGIITVGGALICWPMAYRFGSAVLDYEARLLRVDGAEVHLSPKALELLAILIRSRSRAVSKRELLETLWPSTFVEEANLASLAAEIRRALGDSASNPTFLRTIHRFGYRFVGDVVETAVGATATRACLVFDNRKSMLLEGANVIGRAPDATIQYDVAGVSRHHARIVVSRNVVTIEDLGSKNGTYLQRKRITSAPLSDGDEIRIGNAVLTFRIEPPLAPTETVVIDLP
jgi:DNA-binding winged helix-turn-helix (wHTH) protein